MAEAVGGFCVAGFCGRRHCGVGLDWILVSGGWCPFWFVKTGGEKMKRKHYTRYAMLCLLSVFIIGLMTIMPGCAQEEAVVEPEIPAHFTTYTDEAGLFSISYPPEWEPALSIIEDLEGATKEIITSIDSDLPLERASAIFFAGIPAEEGYSPNMNIVVEQLPKGINTHDELIEASIRGVKMIIDDYHEFSRIKTTVSGRTATILNWEGTVPQIGKTRVVQTGLMVSQTFWTVTCTPPTGEFSKWEEDCNAIVRSLRILK